VLTITDEQRDELRRWAASRTLPAGDVFRARLILALAEGQSYSQIKSCLNTTAPTISRWKQRFEEAGIAGLDPRHQGSRPRVANATMQAKIVRKTQQKPVDGSTHWSCRKMAAELGLSKSTVQRVWAQTRLKPHRLERYMASNDPHFETKAADIIGLYLNPPQHAAVFCVDEKTAIQALDRLDPVLPLSPGRAERHGFEYYRPRNAVSVRRIGCKNRPRTRDDSGASHQPRVHHISGRPGAAHHLGQRNSRCARQSLGAQD
jgi:transposase